MAKSIFLFFIIASAFTLNQVSGSALADLDGAFWNHVDKACQSVSHVLHPGKENTLFLRMIQYTPLGFHSHAVFPSAAGSLLRSKHFDPSKPTVIFAHGFTDSPLLISGQTFALAYKIHGGYNILAIDSSKLIKMLYFRSSFLVKYIGEYLGTFLYDLRRRGVDISKVHLVGHSLGAHIVGFAGKAYTMLAMGEKVPRITGMDPAGPCFTDTDADHRMNATDGAFVDVIHTNARVYGIDREIGQVDFYPNGGGIRQPGCIESICSHNRVWQLWEESVNKPSMFEAVKCDSWEDFKKGRCVTNDKQYMGCKAQAGITGKYYLKTRALPPFGLGKLGVLP